MCVCLFANTLRYSPVRLTLNKCRAQICIIALNLSLFFTKRTTGKWPKRKKDLLCLFVNKYYLIFLCWICVYALRLTEWMNENNNNPLCVRGSEKIKLIDEKTRRKWQTVRESAQFDAKIKFKARTTTAMANWLTNWLTCRFIFCLFVALNLSSLPFQPSFLTLIWAVSIHTRQTHRRQLFGTTTQIRPILACLLSVY